MFWVRAIAAIAVVADAVVVVGGGVVAIAAALGGRCVCCVCQSGWFGWIAAWVLFRDGLGLISICARSSDERLLSECHGESCEKFGCRREHLQPIKCVDAHAAHIQTQTEILQALASGGFQHLKDKQCWSVQRPKDLLLPPRFYQIQMSE